jgi:hypothetical protein
MLVYTPFALCFDYTLWHFYAFSRTNLLTRCHSVSSSFLLLLCFRKVTQEIFSEIDEIKANVPIFFPTQDGVQSRDGGGARGQPHHRVARATPWPRHQVVRPPGPPPDIALPPIYSLRRENPKPDQLSTKRSVATVVVDPRLGGSRSSSRHPAGEGNHHRRPSSSPYLPPEWCVSSLPWTMGQ